MSFFKTVRDSIYNPDFYRTIPLRSLGEAMKYYAKLALILAAVATVAAAVFFLPTIVQMTKMLGTIAVRDYPENLVITISDGVAKTNVKTEPYFIKMPPEFATVKLDPSRDATPAEHMFVIDTRSGADVNAFLGYKSFGMLAQDSLLLYKDHGEVSVQSLRGFGSTTVDRARVAGLADKIPTLVRAFSPGLVILAFIAVLITYAVMLLYFLVLGFFVWIIARVKGLEYDFGASYRTVLYAVTLPLIINFIGIALGLSLPWLLTLLTLVIASVNIKKSVPLPTA